ncbi:MAG: hypothetical protein JSS14_30420 [Proteobacteria bacterium]|nr:hypothetical protein [Pseudomonadota bacterium]
MAESPANSIFSWKTFLVHAGALALLPGLVACDLSASHAATGSQGPFTPASSVVPPTEAGTGFGQPMPNPQETFQSYETWLAQAHASAAGHGENFPLPSQF